MTPLELTELLREHAPLVRKIASELMGRVPASVEMDDLTQVGLIALWEASGRFDESLGIKFGTFAYRRIRGAMLDELRAKDTMNKAQRQKAKTVAVASLVLGQAMGRKPTLGELAQATGMTMNECDQLQVVHMTCDVDALWDVAGGVMPHSQHEQASMHADVVQAIEHLPENERLVVEQHIDHDRTLSDIARERGITESRASQIYNRAIKRLQSKLWAWRQSPQPITIQKF